MDPAFGGTTRTWRSVVRPAPPPFLIDPPGRTCFWPHRPIDVSAGPPTRLASLRGGMRGCRAALRRCSGQPFPSWSTSSSTTTRLPNRTASPTRASSSNRSFAGSTRCDPLSARLTERSGTRVARPLALARSGGRYGDGDAACSPGSRADGSSGFAGCDPSNRGGCRGRPRRPAPETASAGASRQRIRGIDACPEGRTSQRLGAGAKVVGAWRDRRAQSAAAPTVTQSCRIPHAQCCRSSQR